MVFKLKLTTDWDVTWSEMNVMVLSSVSREQLNIGAAVIYLWCVESKRLMHEQKNSLSHSYIIITYKVVPLLIIPGGVDRYDGCCCIWSLLGLKFRAWSGFPVQQTRATASSLIDAHLPSLNQIPPLRYIYIRNWFVENYTPSKYSIFKIGC